MITTHNYATRAVAFFGRAESLKTQRRWSEDELKRARDMRAAGHSYREIDGMRHLR